MIILFDTLETPVRFIGRLYVVSQDRDGIKRYDEINDKAFREGSLITLAFNTAKRSIDMYVDGLEWYHIKGVISLIQQLYGTFEPVHLWGDIVPFDSIPKLDDYLNLYKKEVNI